MSVVIDQPLKPMIRVTASVTEMEGTGIGQSPKWSIKASAHRSVLRSQRVQSQEQHTPVTGCYGLYTPLSYKTVVGCSKFDAHDSCKIKKYIK